jgi:N-glycosylase/DNA lyase
MDLQIFSHQLVELRKEHNLTQEELGKLIGVSKVSICHYENGIQFPTLDKLINIKELEFRECKVGFRDKYLVNVIRAISTGELDINKIYNMDSNDALEYLISFKGIGMKVASCILLFAYQKFDVYPIDTWVKKYMLDNYNIEGEINIRNYCTKTFKEYSGLAIQYMFNSKRNKDM